MSDRFRFPESAGDLIGAHLSTNGGLHTIFERASAVRAGSIAMFSKNSTQWKARVLTDEDCRLFHDTRGAARQPLLVHASYLINLATVNPIFRRKSRAAMIEELLRAERLGAGAVVLHPGAHLGAGSKKGVERIARALDRIHAAIPDCRTITLLETAAGQGSCLGCSFEELGTILRLVDDPVRVGVCFDTCHVFSAGYELRTRDGYERTIDELDRHVGLENVGAFHLNDSKKPLGSRVDRHQHIGQGELGLEPFRFLLNDKRFRGIPKLIETPKLHPINDDIRNLELLRSLITPESSRRRSEVTG